MGSQIEQLRETLAEAGSEPREGWLEAISSSAARPKSAEIRARAIWSIVFQKRVLRTRG